MSNQAGKLVLGVDTSNYTTSVALATDCGTFFRESRKLLSVKSGQRGLRQSEAFYQHVMNLPGLLEELLEGVDPDQLCAVSVSTRPRDQEDSYMPCFIAGLQMARTISLTRQIPIIETTHQDGHIMAAQFELPVPLDKQALSVHLSGGTSEILLSSWNGSSFDVDLVGGTLDISAGQLLDRIGVALGYDFPCGKQLDELAEMGTGALKFPTTVKGTYFNLSGAESHGLKHVHQAADADIAHALFTAIHKTLDKAIANAAKMHGVQDVIMAGGVSSSAWMKPRLTKSLGHKGITVHFSRPAFAADNAIGVALIGAMRVG